MEEMDWEQLIPIFYDEGEPQISDLRDSQTQYDIWNHKAITN